MKKLLLAFATTLTLFGAANTASAYNIAIYGPWQLVAVWHFGVEGTQCGWGRVEIFNGVVKNHYVITDGEKFADICPAPTF